MSTGGFLERWSRRKLAEDKAEGAQSDHGPEEAAAPAAEPPVEETLDEAELARLPSLESFTLETDLTAFLRKGVPHALRNAAMRKMWMLDPAIRDHKDLAVDYAWDWNTPGGVPGNSGSISSEGLARMLDNLNPQPPEPATAHTGPAEEAPGAGKSSAAAADPEVRPQSHALASKLQETTDKSVSDAPRPAVKPMPRPRRHGRAAPV